MPPYLSHLAIGVVARSERSLISSEKTELIEIVMVPAMVPHVNLCFVFDSMFEW